jgi:predicted amidohydrolase
VGTRVIAAAQSISMGGDIEANIQRHLAFMRAAIGKGVRFLLFPELSLTGYERALAERLAIDPADTRLQSLHELARASGMVTVVGAPIRLADRPDLFIAALVLGGAEVAVYTKRHLHPGEDEVFRTGDGGARVRIATDYIALAVCADFSHASHATAAAQSGATVYAASVLITEGGYGADTELLAGYAGEHRMAVLMANHGGPTGGWKSAGRSAFWSEEGTLVGEIDGAGDALLVAMGDAEGWVTETILMSV